MKRFVMAVVVLAVFAGVADAQCGVGSRLFNGSHPIRTALFGTSTASACGSASAAGACNSAASTCSAATAPVSVTTPVGSVRSTVVHDFIRLKVAAKLRLAGKTAGEARTLSESLTDQIVEGAGSAVGVPGGFFQQILADLVACEQNPTCSAVVTALVNYLLKLIGG